MFNSLHDFFYNQDIIQSLKQYCNSCDNNINHIIFHGTNGSGMEYLTPCFIKHIFGLSNLDLVPIPNFNNKVITKKSNVHFEIKLYVNQSNDKNILTSFIEEYCSTINMYNGKYNILVLYNYHFFSKIAENSLKRILESHYNTLRIIFITQNISKIDQAIKSRCQTIRFPCPKKKRFRIIFER